MTDLAKEIHRRALELMYYIAANTNSNEEYESALSQAAIDLLDEAVAFEDAAGIGPEPWDDDKALALAEALDTSDDYDDDFDPFNDTDENIWPSNDYDDDEYDEDDLTDDDLVSLWDDENDDDDDTEYRQQADGRVL